MKTGTYRLGERLAEVRRRMITDFWDGTSPMAGHWWSCRVCTRTWRDGQPESHEPGCPLEGAGVTR